MLKKILWFIYGLFSLTFLVYLLAPGPTSIKDFPALPNAVKSSLEGDTIQVPNVAAYFSDNFRDFVAPFFLKSFEAKTKFFFPPLRLNHPPEDAFAFIKDQTQSTYLEELTYPLRDSLFVNGLEPVDETGQPRYWGGDKFEIDGKRLSTKVTLRYYPSSPAYRIIVWIGINVSTILLFLTAKRILKHES